MSPRSTTRSKAAPAVPVEPPSTRERIIRAALAEFMDVGFGSTDTNKIARRAGFAPQTFYRWFSDKVTVFVAAYAAWESDEWSMLEGLIESQAKAEAIVDAVIAHHQATLIFRRSLHQLAVELTPVREARAASRKRQVQKLLNWAALDKRSFDAVALKLFQFERLVDAHVEGELRDMGVPPAKTRAELCGLLKALAV
ncbi:MAG: TetR/AcrR family transcriptional regulator [Pseudomonadota bacterium]|nr:TetR/AcrR family transcriptional regulator [Pseudomonadota bacterium]